MHLPKCEYCGSSTEIKDIGSTDNPMLLCTKCAKPQTLPSCPYCNKPTKIVYAKDSHGGHPALVCTACHKFYEKQSFLQRILGRRKR